MGLFGRRSEQEDSHSELPELMDADPLIGKQATSKSGHVGTVETVYLFPDGHKMVDIQDTQGRVACGLAPGEYTVKE